MPRKSVHELNAAELKARREYMREAKARSRARARAEGSNEKQRKRDRRRYNRVRYLKANRSEFVEPCPKCLSEIELRPINDEVVGVFCTGSGQFIAHGNGRGLLWFDRKVEPRREWNRYYSMNVKKAWLYVIDLVT